MTNAPSHENAKQELRSPSLRLERQESNYHKKQRHRTTTRCLRQPRNGKVRERTGRIDERTAHMKKNHKKARNEPNKINPSDVYARGHGCIARSVLIQRRAWRHAYIFLTPIRSRRPFALRIEAHGNGHHAVHKVSRPPFALQTSGPDDQRSQNTLPGFVTMLPSWISWPLNRAAYSSCSLHGSCRSGRREGRCNISRCRRSSRRSPSAPFPSSLIPSSLLPSRGLRYRLGRISCCR